MAYVPPEQRNTAYYLFHEIFKVRVNPTKIRTIEEIKLYGTPTTGNEDMDRELAKDETIVMISIAQMEDIYNQGYPVKIVDYEDTKTIYEYISKHLIAMRNLMQGSENFTNDPKTMDELIRLDQFAAAMFGHARFLMREDIAQSPLVARMRADRFSALGKLGRSRNPQGEQTVVQGKGSGSLRDYSTGGEEAVNALPRVEPGQVMVPDEMPEDPSLPRRVGLERLFEQQKRMGLNWGGNN